MLPKPQDGILGREGKGEKIEKGDKRRKRGGQEMEGVSNRNFAEGPPNTALRESIAYARPTLVL